MVNAGWRLRYVSFQSPSTAHCPGLLLREVVGGRNTSREITLSKLAWISGLLMLLNLETIFTKSLPPIS